MNQLEIETLKILDAHKISNQVLILGVSGGLDSIVLSALFSQIAPRRNLKIILFYAHHGAAANDSTLKYRNQALEHVKKLAQQFDFQFDEERHSDLELKSEAELREFRICALEKSRQKNAASYIVLAHHRDDLMETRMMRLLRGVGPQGLESMSALSGPFFRPLLSFSRKQLEDYAQSRELVWIEDPSNSSPEYLRNWMRNIWLPMAEEKRPGSLAALATSLENLIPNDSASSEIKVSLEGLERFELVKLNFREQRQALAKYVSLVGLRDYSVTHLDEIIKRLDSSQKEFTFILLGRKWCVDTRRIWVE